jgi:hypothetical protein
MRLREHRGTGSANGHRQRVRSVDELAAGDAPDGLKRRD